MKPFRMTLVELLVIIAIVSVLAALLTPALHKAQNKGKEIKCMGNFRQMGIGFAVYCNDNQDFSPIANATMYVYDWRNRIQASAGGSYLTAQCTELAAAMEQYNRIASESSRKDLNNPAHAWIRTAFCTGNFNLNNFRMTGLRTPSQTGIMVDGTFKGGKHLTTSLNYDQVGWRHSKKSSIMCYADGHVKTHPHTGNNALIKNEFNP